MSKLQLTIELVPSSSWTDNVRAIVTTKQWDIIRKSVYDQAYHICEICGNVGPKHPVECHEVWHYDDKKHIQKLVRMIALCPKCHLVKHFGFAQVQGKKTIALHHFMKINGLKKSEAEAYIKQCFETWLKRSTHAWTLDVSILKQYGINATYLQSRIEKE